MHKSLINPDDLRDGMNLPSIHIKVSKLKNRSRAEIAGIKTRNNLPQNKHCGR